jgi:hypothetical protein
MSHRTSEPAREQHVHRAVVPPIGLFSHPPEADVFEQRHPPGGHGDGAEWRATSFSGGPPSNTAGSSATRRTNAGYRRQPGRRPSTTTPRFHHDPGAAGRG